MHRGISDGFLILSRNAGRAMLVSLGLVIFFAAQLREPQFAGSIADLISARSPVLVAAEEIAAARGNQQMLLILVEAGQETIAEAFDRLDRVAPMLQQQGLESEVRSLHTLRDQLFVFGLQETDALSELLGGLRDAGEQLSLVAQDARSYSVAVTVADEREAAALLALREFDFGGGRVEFLAGAALESDIASGLRRDLRILIPSIVFVMLATILIAFRHWRALILPAYASVASAVVTFSVLSMLGVTINLVTLLALPIVLIVALANSCHFLARADRVKDDGHGAVFSSLSLVGVPYLVSCTTTAVALALASLAFNTIDPVRDLGYVTSLSLLISFVLILLAAPWALRWYLGVSVRPPSRLYRFVSSFLRRRRKVIAALLVAGAAAGMLAAPAVKVQSDPKVFFPDNADFTRAFDLFEKQYYVFAPLRVLVRGSDSGGPDVGMLRFASEVRSQMEAADGVVSSMMEPAANDSGILVTALVVDDASQRALTERVAGLGDGADYELVVSSSMMVYESIDSLALSSLGESLGVSVLIIFGVIVLLFRSVRVFVSSVIANAVPLATILAVVWFVDDPLNLVTAFVFLVALGVIVDDTIHILWRERENESLSGSSIEYSVILSTVMLCLGLLLCQLSDFPTTRQFATYCALALTGAVISDLSVLPALLKYRGWKRLARFSR